MAEIKLSAAFKCVNTVWFVTSNSEILFRLIFSDVRDTKASNPVASEMDLLSTSNAVILAISVRGT